MTETFLVIFQDSKAKISVDRMIEAQKKGRFIRDFDEDLDYYLKNEF